MVTIRRDADKFDIDDGCFRARWHFSSDQYSDPEIGTYGHGRRPT